MTEMIGVIALATVCILMACLNLWNIFKDWFDGRYQKKNNTVQTERQLTNQKIIPDVIGKSKPVLRELPPIQKPDEEKQRLEKEIFELKRQLAEQEENKPFMSVDLLETEQPEHIDLEEVNLTEKYHNPSELSRYFNSGTTLDEFELMAKALTGKPMDKEEEKQVGHIILPKVIGTEFYNQFTRQVQGAEERANMILNQVDNGVDSLEGQGFDYNGI